MSTPKSRVAALNGAMVTMAKLRRFLHLLVADLLYYSGILACWQFLRRRAADEVCVVCLHRVLKEEDRQRCGSLDSMTMKEATFAAMLEYLRKKFRFVSLEKFLRRGRANSARSRPLCLLTFDDGWKDNFTTAFPWLKEFQLPAVIFLMTGFVDTVETFWVERLNWAWREPDARQRILSRLEHPGEVQGRPSQCHEIVELLKRMSASERQEILAPVIGVGNRPALAGDVDRMLTWEEVSTMSREGIEFGAHSVTHPLLILEDAARVEEELVTSKQVIEKKLGKAVQAFAYPNGNWNDQVRRLTKQAGYACAFTTQRGWHSRADDRYTIKRIMLHEGVVTGRGGRFSPAMLNLRLSGWF